MNGFLAAGVFVAVCASGCEHASAPSNVDAGADAPVGIQPSPFTSNLGCTASEGGGGGLVACAIAFACYRRRSLVAAAMLAASPARAEPPLTELETPASQPPRRYVTVTYNPLTLIIDRYGGNVEVVPWVHHAVIATLYWMNTTTTPASLETHYDGIGGELGYRYYAGTSGPHGFFAGPSLLLGRFTGEPQLGDAVEVSNIGGAFDVGYQALVKGRLALGLAFGLQYTWASEDLPQQELPASIYVNNGLRPRWILAIGAAF